MSSLAKTLMKKRGKDKVIPHFFPGGGFDLPSIAPPNSGIFDQASSLGQQLPLAQGADKWGAKASDAWKSNYGHGLGTGSLVPSNSFQATPAVNQFNAVAPTFDRQNIAAQLGDARINPMHANFDQANYMGNQQQQLANMLMDQSRGYGPGQQLAQNMLNQSTQNNIAQGNAMIASQKGINPGLAARAIADNTAAQNQQAVMQGTNLGLQAQLGAQGQLGGQLGGMRQQDVSQAMGNANLGLEQQNMLLGANQAQNALLSQGQLGTNALNAAVAQQNSQNQMAAQQINSGVAGQNAQMRAGMLGGGINALGSLGASAVGQGGLLSGLFSGGSSAASGLGVGSTVADSTAGGMGSIAMDGAMAAHGALIPGKPRVSGDSIKNDTVNARLSPGEIVIPRSITQHPHAPYLAAEFVRNALAGNGPKPQYKKMADGGEVPDADGGETPEVDEQPSDPENLEGSKAAARDSGQSVHKWLVRALSPMNPDYVPPQGAQPTQNPDAIPAMATPDQVPMASAGQGFINANLKSLTPDQDSQDLANTQNNGLSGLQQPNNAYETALTQQEAGIKQLAGAQSAESANQAKAIRQSITQQQSDTRDYQRRLTKLDGENNQLTEAVANGKLDPNRVWSNTSTGGKIAAGIGVLLSGIGSGLTGGPNMAMAVINKSIDEDINAQKMEIGKNENLLSRNLQKYGRLDAAYAATKSQNLALLQGQISLAAAQSGDAKAKANAQIALSQIQMQRAGLQHQQAMYDYFAKPQNGGPKQGVDTGRLMVGIQSGIIPKEFAGTAMKESGEYQKLNNSIKSVKGAFDKVDQLQNVSERLGNPIQSTRQIDAIEKLYSAQLAKDLEGRATPQDIDSLMENFPKLTDSKETRTQKYRDLNNSIKAKFSFPTLQSYGLLGKNDQTVAMDSDEPMGTKVASVK